MYLPEIYNNRNRQDIVNFINTYSFADLVSCNKGKITSNKVPFLFDEKEDRLFGHFGNTNEQLRDLSRGDEVLVIFSGAHSYISPKWAVTKNMVPTWNFQTLQVRGRPNLLEQDELNNVLKALSAKHESETASSDEDQWFMEDVEPDKLKLMTNLITAFEIKIDTVQFKEKLSQNRGERDRANVVKELERNGNSSILNIASIMQRALNN